MNNVYKLIDAMTARGLIVQSLDFGKVVRVATTDKPKKLNGWYIAYENPLMVVFGDWAKDYTEKHIHSDRLLSKVEYAEIHRRIKEANIKKELSLREERKANKKALQSVLSGCYSIKGTPVEKYLNNRGITLKEDFKALLYHPHLPYWEDGKCTYYPAMIGVVTNKEGELVTLHRTYITEDGQKAPVSTPKKLMKTCQPMQGASIKLGEPCNGYPKDIFLGIAEGIETALSASQIFDVPVWSCVSAGGVKTFELPTEVTHITFYSDNDEAGLTASKTAGKRLMGQGINCTLTHPLDTKDWNDELKKEQELNNEL